MKHPKKIKLTSREKRAKRVRRTVTGSSDRPRLSVSRSLKNVYVQLIDDVKGVTLIGLASVGPEIRNMKIEDGKVGVAKAVGKLLAEKAKAIGITRIVFDRAGYLYHGRVKAIAEGAREGGLEF
ncbi:MAG: 50S ribosomal protein L18 [Candidatus Latescibacterota bacterium]